MAKCPHSPFWSEGVCGSDCTVFVFDRGQEEKGVTEDETVGWHHQLNGPEF